MNILLVVTKAEIGGAQQVVLDLARGLKDKGHAVTVAFGGEGEFLPKALAQADIDWHRFDYLSRSKNPLSGLAFALELYHFVRGNDFDLIHLHSSNALYGSLGAAFVSAQSVFTFHGMSVLAPGYQKAALLKMVYAAFFAVFSRLLNAAVFLTESDRQVACSWGVRAKQEVVIPNGLMPEDIHYLRPDEARQQLANKIGADLSGKTTVGSIGRLHYQKHYDFLIDAADNLREKITDVVYIVIGDGPQADELRETVSERGLEEAIHFVGAIPNAARLMPAFDVFALVSRYEGLPITLLEALFAGVPVLASDVGGNAEVVADPDTQTFTAGNRDEFANKLARLITDEKLRKEIVSKQNKHKERFTFDTVLDKHLDLYRQLCA